ncbi:hypothetical protein RYX36_001980 [Vicia faba]
MTDTEVESQVFACALSGLNPAYRSLLTNQGKHSCYAVGSSSHYRQSVEAEHVEFDNTRFTGPLQQAQFYRNLVSEYLNHPLTLQRGELFSYQKRAARWKIDVAQVISNEIQRIAITGHSHGNKAPMTLGFPALITGLCRKPGDYIPNVATKRISSIVNEDYVLWHCVPKLAGEASPQSQAHVPPARYNK